jgi:glutamate/tyrosine decarboxylase-like PLP-dependent enzyme
MADHATTDLQPLRNALIRCCNDHTADEAIRAMASALTTLIISATADREKALLAFEKLVAAMLAHIEAAAWPAGIPKQ